MYVWWSFMDADEKYVWSSAFAAWKFSQIWDSILTSDKIKDKRVRRCISGLTDLLKITPMQSQSKEWDVILTQNSHMRLWTLIVIWDIWTWSLLITTIPSYCWTSPQLLNYLILNSESQPCESLCSTWNELSIIIFYIIMFLFFVFYKKIYQINKKKKKKITMFCRKWWREKQKEYDMHWNAKDMTLHYNLLFEFIVFNFHLP